VASTLLLQAAADAEQSLTVEYMMPDGAFATGGNGSAFPASTDPITMVKSTGGSRTLGVEPAGFTIATVLLSGLSGVTALVAALIVAKWCVCPLALSELLLDGFTALLLMNTVFPQRWPASFVDVQHVLQLFARAQLPSVAIAAWGLWLRPLVWATRLGVLSVLHIELTVTIQRVSPSPAHASTASSTESQQPRSSR
jgi:hypothetical protein